MGLEDVKLRVEPGLIEWPGWYTSGIIPNWLTVEEIANHGFNVDLNYVPYTTAAEINMKETAGEYYDRTFSLVKYALEDASGKL